MESVHVTIEVMSGAEDGRSFELHKFPVMIGRHPDDDILLLHDHKISRHHARISHDAEIFYIEDIGAKGEGSTNGTFINGRKINTKTSISNGDMLLLGAIWLRFEKRNDFILDSSNSHRSQQ